MGNSVPGKKAGSRKKRSFSVLVLCHEFPPIGGGAGRMANLLCKGLNKSKSKPKIKVWTNHPNQELPEFPYEVVYFPSPRKARFSTNFWAMLSFMIQSTWRALRRPSEKPDWILSAMAIPAGLPGWLISKIWRVPHGIWYLGSDVHAGKMTGPGKVQKILLQFLWNRSEVNFFASQSLRKFVDPKGRIPNVKILPMATTFRNRKEPVRKNVKQFLFAARLDPVKNPSVFLEAVKIFNNMADKEKGKTKSKVKFIMAGSGKLLEELRGEYNFDSWDNFVLDETITHKNLPDLYRDSYATVLTSKMEGFPLNILEAGRYKTPCIGANTTGLDEAIQDGVTGLLFEPNNPQDLAKKIKYLVDNPRKRRALGEKAFEYSNQFTPENTAKVFAATMENLAA